MMRSYLAALTASLVLGGAALTAQQASQPSREQTRDDVFVVDERGQQRLVETTESTQETLANGSTRRVETTSTPDANGRLGVASQYVENTTTTASGRRETVGSVFQPGVDGALSEVRRTESTEREVAPGVVREDSVERVLGQNSQWETAEVRSRETKTVGPGSSVAEETIQRPDANGRLVASQRDVTRRTEANGRVVEVTETFGDNQQGRTRPATPMGLSQRVTRTTTAGAEGASKTIEEVEGRSAAAPNEGIQVIRRTVETVRTVGTRTETRREVYERDVNGRMVLITSDTATDPVAAGTSGPR